VWYDALTAGGALRWQSALNAENAGFFDACGAIFLDYHWKGPKALRASSDAAAARAGAPGAAVAGAPGAASAEGGRPALRGAARRRLSAYAAEADASAGAAAAAADARAAVLVGCDVWGRGQWGGGQWRCGDALAAIAASGAGAALFAPAWTYEALGGDADAAAFDELEARFWRGERCSDDCLRNGANADGFDAADGAGGVLSGWDVLEAGGGGWKLEPLAAGAAPAAGRARGGAAGGCAAVTSHAW